MKRKREEILGNFDIDLMHFKTYPPLQEFFIDFFEKMHCGQPPVCPDTVDPKYLVEIQLAFEDQSAIGWQHFARGLISKRWRHLQLCFLYNNDNKDMYAVDKWTRMVIRNILEYNRLLWNERCDVLHVESDCTYQDRQRQEIYNLCQYLRTRKRLIPDSDHHFLKKDPSFFFRSPIENVLNWEKRIIISLKPAKNKRNRDIRGYLIETTNPYQTQILPPLPSKPANTKRLISNKTLQYTMNSFVLTSTSLSTTTTDLCPPQEKKQKHNTLTQPTLLDTLAITSQLNSISRQLTPQPKLKRDCPPSSGNLTGFKRCRFTPPTSTSKKRMESLVTQHKLEKRRKKE